MKSTPMATPPATATSSPVPAVAAGSTSSRSRLTRSVVAASCGAVVGITRHNAAVGSFVVGDRRADERDAGVGSDGVGDRLAASLGRCPVELGGQAERAVEAGPEPVGEQVVGLAGGGVLGVVALVGEPEAQPEDRQRERDQAAAPTQDGGPRAVLDDPTPPVRQRLAQRLALPLQHRFAQRGDGEAGQQHDDGDRQRDHDQGGDPEPDPDQGDGDQAGGDQARAGG